MANAMNGIDRTTIEYDGQEADLGSPEGEELVGRAVGNAIRNGRAGERQLSMMVLFPDMDEKASLVDRTVRSVAKHFPKGAKVNLGVGVPVEFWLEDGTHMEGEFTFKFTAKPAKAKV